jgi:hypothetical protein
VSFKDYHVNEWSQVIAGNTVFEAVRAAQVWFEDPFWKGPKPTLDTVFKGKCCNFDGVLEEIPHRTPVDSMTTWVTPRDRSQFFNSISSEVKVPNVRLSTSVCPSPGPEISTQVLIDFL